MHDQPKFTAPPGGFPAQPSAQPPSGDAFLPQQPGSPFSQAAAEPYPQQPSAQQAYPQQPSALQRPTAAGQSAPPLAHEGQYLPPPPVQPSAKSGWKNSVGPGVIGIGLLFAKFKTVLLLLLNIKWVLIGVKVFASSFTFLASVWFYALFFGWPFALVFTLLILVHELGHAAFMKIFGVPASLPYFIPGFGALITMKGRPASALQESYIALAGPLMGTVAALACYTYGEATQSQFWIAAAYTGFFLNLFNLLPVAPLDGGRVVGAVSPRIWIFGLVALIVTAIAFHWFNPLIIVLIAFAIPQVIAAWKGTLDPRYYELTMGQRGGIAVAYFALVGFLIVAMLSSHISVQPIAT